MDPKAGNPFLLDDYPTEEDATRSQVSNPFLQDFVNTETSSPPTAPMADVNPFFNFGAEQSNRSQSDSTNPFASFGVEATVPEPEAASVPAPAMPSLFDDEAALGMGTTMVQTTVTPISAQPLLSTSESSKPSKPPVPPRPSPPPPPRNTKDLILSVTGAMDETSNQMLNRLQATRTPSPTLMQSSSPTPEQSLADFIDVDNNIPDLVHDSVKNDHPTPAGSNDQDILGIFDAPGKQQTANPPEAFGEKLTATDEIASVGPPVRASDNPFSNVEQQAAEAYEPAVTDVEQQLEIQASSELFSNASIGTSTAQASSYYSTAQPRIGFAAPSQEAFGNLLGDFSMEKSTHDMESNSTTASKLPQEANEVFDEFSYKFEKAAEAYSSSSPMYDPFTSGSAYGQTDMDTSSDVWGDSMHVTGSEPVTGFDDGDNFDSFLSMVEPPPDVVSKRRGSDESDKSPDFSVTIKPKDGEHMTFGQDGSVPVLAPPPKSPLTAAYADTSPRFNPFDKSDKFAQEAVIHTEAALPSEMTRTDSQETPPTPLFDEDVSQPLEDFPRTSYSGDGWDMQLRQPVKKKITGQRFWKHVFLRITNNGDSLPVLQLFNNKTDKDPYQELPLLPCYSVSEIAAQQFDQYGKIFTVKLQYLFYKERPGLRPGQVTKAERITTKLSQFAAYAIQGDLQGVKEFGSDVKKLGMPVEHAPQISQLLKLGSQNYEDMKVFSVVFEEALFRLSIHRDRALQYKVEEVQISVVDELYVDQNANGHIEKQIARVRLFFLGFLSGMPDVELGMNDIWRQGKEVVSRHDIIPVATEEWIRLEDIEFHACIQQDEYEKSRIIKFKPPDACYIELMRFRVRPPRNRELPLQLKAVMCVTGNKVELRADILVPGFASRKLGRIPCEDVMVRFPIPECWIYLFRVEKHFRYGSVKSAHRRTGKIKGIERFLGAVDTLEPQLMEVTSGQAKYEHQHHAIVWRMSRLPKDGQGAYTTHQLVCRMNLTSYDQIPEKLSEYAYVEFTMPMTQVSHTMVRSVSFQNFDSDMPPEKYVKNLSRHEYRVQIEHTQGEGPGAYISATSMSTPSKVIPESSGESHDEGTDHPATDSDSSN